MYRGNKVIFGEGLISTLGTFFSPSTQRNDSYSTIYEGEQHRKQRKILNPVFSLANMRELLPVIQPIASKMRSVLLSQLPDDGGERDSGVFLAHRDVLNCPLRITRDRCSALDVAGNIGIYIASWFGSHFQCPRAHSEPRLRKGHQKLRVSRLHRILCRSNLTQAQSSRAEADFSAPVCTLHCSQRFVVLAEQVGGLAPHKSLARSPKYCPSHG